MTRRRTSLMYIIYYSKHYMSIVSISKNRQQSMDSMYSYGIGIPTINHIM